MSRHLRQLAVVVAVAAGVLSVTGAQAQYYVQQTPNTYLVQRPSHARAYPYMHCQNCGRSARAPLGRIVVNTRKFVQDPPVVVETQRVVEDPPRVIERQHIARDDRNKSVIQADAEITILGPDRMNIRLFRKGQGSKADTHTE